MHIGLIGGIGPAATEFYYRGLIDRHAKSGTRLELTIANAAGRDLSQNLANKDARKQAAIFVALITRLKAAGAQAAAVTSNASAMRSAACFLPRESAYTGNLAPRSYCWAEPTSF